jgi:hypothetical protein
MGNEKITKQLTTKIVSGNDPRTITMIASTGTTDRAGDDLAMDNWILTDFLKNPVFLYCHNLCEQKAPIGIIKSIRIVNNEMWIMVYFPKIEELTSYFDTPELIHDHAKFVDFIYNSYKNGLMKGVSVGFTGKWTPKDSSDIWGGGRAFTEQTLIEISAAPVPCNPDALAQVPKSFLEDITRGGNNMNTPEKKSGRKYSAESIAEMKAIYNEMNEAHCKYKEDCDLYHKKITAAHKKFAQLTEPNEITGDDPDKDKSNEGKGLTTFDSLLNNILEIIKE